MGMFGTGWVWLVCDSKGMLAIIPTFGTETLLGINRQSTRSGETSWRTRLSGRAEPAQRPTSPLTGSTESTTPAMQPPSITRSFSHTSVSHYNAYLAPSTLDDVSQRSSTRNIGDVLYPLMCLSVHEHAWLSAGYGIWGKEEYVRRFWSVVDWSKISVDFGNFATDFAERQ